MQPKKPDPENYSAHQPYPQKQKHNQQLAILTQEHARYTIKTEQNPAKAEDNSTVDESTTSRNTQTARLAAEISNTIEQQANTDRTRYLNSSTKAFTPAKYMREWINRVERVGNLNYPDKARRKKLSGTLILDVVINADGTLLKTDLRQSSGHQILDDAAKRIVQLAAPFSAFSKKLRQEADVIHITRSWEFLNNSQLRTR
jgi:protein TonB